MVGAGRGPIAPARALILYCRQPPSAWRPALASAIERALRLYDDQALATRAFVRARHWLAPLEPIAAEVPRQGRVLDLGCGHGLFSALLALESAERDVLGVDPSPAKIAVARAAAGRLPNARFQQGTVDHVVEGGFHAITVLDVLYLLPPADKEHLLRRCRALLAPDGILVLKTNDTSPRWRYLVTRWQERLMTGLGLTMGHGLYFYSQGQHLALLRAVGFQARVRRLRGWWPYPHLLFLCRPAGEASA